MKIRFLFFLLLLSAAGTGAQTTIQGKVTDKSGEPLFGVSIWCNGATQAGTASGFSGEYQLEMPAGCDSLHFAYIGYTARQLSLTDLQNLQFTVRLEDQAHMLDEVSIRADDPISDKFSVVKLEKLEIYRSPVSAGDPLKAITALPSSTNADETADPVLRGSSSDRSRVMLNGVPLRSPVRNGQINGLGNFSLLNSEMIRHLYVYASNPPLTFGNSSAGLVEVETNLELEKNQLQLSAGLAGGGFFLSQKTGGKNFLQAYGNFQFSDAFLGLNKANMPQLIDFGTQDGGLHLKINTGKRSYFQSFSYAIGESYEARSNLFAYDGVIDAGKKRFFTVNNWTRNFENGRLRLSALLDKSDQRFAFGNLRSEVKNTTDYYAADYRLFLSSKFSLQTGLQYNRWKYDLNNRQSQYYYAVAPEAPSILQDTLLLQHNLEGYTYLNYDINSRWNVSAGLRCNVPVFAREQFYWSRQLSVKFEPDTRHRFLLGGGVYHNYSTPNFISPSIDLLNSRQAALDYYYTAKHFQLSGAVFYKRESGRYLEADFFSFDRIRTYGAELMLRKKMFRYFELTLSNTFLDQEIETADGERYPGANGFRYFTKMLLQFEHSSIVTAGLTYIFRPGKLYTPVTGSIYQQEISAYEPQFAPVLNSFRFNDYRNLSFSANRYFPMGRNAVVVFASVTNLFNRNNEAVDRYNTDYSRRHFDYYQLRTIYFGGVVMLGGRK